MVEVAGNPWGGSRDPAYAYRSYAVGDLVSE